MAQQKLISPLHKQLQQNNVRKTALAMMLLSFLGFVDAAYLSSHALFGTPLKCTISNGCATVAASPYSTVFDIPIPVIGVFFYLTVFFGAMFYREYASKHVLKITSGFTVCGFLMSIWLVIVQLFIERTICEYCMLSAGISVSLFVLGMVTLYHLRLGRKLPVLPRHET